MDRSSATYWAVLIVLALILGGGVVAYARLAVADFEQDAARSALLTPQARAGVRLLHDKRMEL